jgi:hypothetical protein
MDQLRAIAETAKPNSGTRAYYLARLQAQRPDLVAEVASGIMSVNAAAIAAGFRKQSARKSKWTSIGAYAPQLENA